MDNHFWMPCSNQETEACLSFYAATIHQAITLERFTRSENKTNFALFDGDAGKILMQHLLEIHRVSSIDDACQFLVDNCGRGEDSSDWEKIITRQVVYEQTNVSLAVSSSSETRVMRLVDQSYGFNTLTWIILGNLTIGNFLIFKFPVFRRFKASLNPVSDYKQMKKDLRARFTEVLEVENLPDAKTLQEVTLVVPEVSQPGKLISFRDWFTVRRNKYPDFNIRQMCEL